MDRAVPLKFLEIDNAVSSPEWDDFVSRCPGAHHEQTTHWAMAKRTAGWEAYRILVRNEAGLIGGAQVLHRRIKRFASIGYISRGPMFLSADKAAIVTQQVVEGLKRTGHHYLTVLPNYEWSHVVPGLQANGFFSKPNALPPSNLVTATLIIDLTQDLGSILVGMRSKTRQYVRKGEKGGLVVTEGGVADIPVFFRLMCQLCERRGIAPHPASIDHFLAYWHHLAPAGIVKLFVGRYQSKEVVAAFAFVYGDTIRVLKIGWSGECDDCCPNYALWWEMIKWAKAAGLRQFDFEQILPEHAEAILRGETVDDSYWGVTRFKIGFGGKIHMIPDSYYRSFNRGGQAILKRGGAKLLASPLLLKWAARLA